MNDDVLKKCGQWAGLVVMAALTLVVVAAAVAAAKWLLGW